MGNQSAAMGEMDDEGLFNRPRTGGIYRSARYDHREWYYVVRLITIRAIIGTITARKKEKPS
jgi:hypothetical protein